MLVDSDPLKIKQVISNLISNAIKYTLEGYIEFGASLENGQLVFRVEDSGIGIPTDKLDDIFKPFVRTDSGSKISEGSGYGLSVVKGLVDLMEGTIEVQSEVGKGSCFTVRIPAETLIAETDTEAAESQMRQATVDLVAQRHILIIDDDDTLLTVVSNMIEKLGHRVQICRSKNDIDEALQNKDAFDCVLTDREMGAISGNTILKVFKKADRNKPVYLMTARVDYDTDKATQEGFDGFLQKPFKIKDLETMFGHASQGDDQGTATVSERSVPVRAGAAGGEGELIYFCPEGLLQMIGE